MRPAAIYARVSSEQQKEDKTISSQTEALLEFARDQNYSVPSEWVFEDEGYSGSTLVRPGLEKLRDLASEGQLQALLVYSPDRLSRKYAYQVLLIEEFARYGLDVLFLKSPRANTPEEELLLQFQGMIAEYERAQIVERSRRGKRHRAKLGSVNVLGGAPYGYRYVKKTEHSEAYYEVIEREAEVVREIYRFFTEERWALGAIARQLSDKGIPTRTGKERWDRSVIWAILRNPAYKGKACFGKTEIVERRKVTRRLRQRGGYSPRSSANRERPRDEWIEIPVPAIISEETFNLAQELLHRNRQLSLRRTKEPSLLQGLLVCGECSYAYYRTSTRTSKRKIYYYRCLGSDDYRYPNGRICSNRPIRQDYLDELVWSQISELLANPELIRQEMERRIRQALDSGPVQKRKDVLVKEQRRIQKGIDKLLDAYQEDLLSLSELRQRIPNLKKRETAVTSELQNLEAQQIDRARFLQVSANMEHLVSQLRRKAESLDVTERQKILRTLVKEIFVGKDTIKIRHSIPNIGKVGASQDKSYPLRWGRSLAGACQYLFALCP
ncbi:recombinase family protein [Candidatus Bathyarchaeota archaeon]|nr:recombinase family protein [Candidatus Bathyarchaeota archaeon]